MKKIIGTLLLIPAFIFIQACDDSGGSGSCTPTQEICDGIDNDCDGVIDNGFECKAGDTQECGSDEGACSKGTQSCTAQCTWATECTGEVGPAQEECDGIDNNCDGSVDEDLTQVCNSACGSGTEICANGQWSNCTATQPTDEVCDGIDNDCDGEVDNGTGMECVKSSTRTCGSDVGTCVSGTELCDDTCHWTGTCLGETAPGTETCNDIDDNCDGIIDNGIFAADEGMAINDTCAQATQEPALAEGDTNYYGEITNNIYHADASDIDVDYFKFSVTEYSDLACVLHSSYNECHEYLLLVTGDATDVNYDFDVIMTNLTYDDVESDRLAMCQTADSSYTFSSTGGYLDIKLAGDCLTDMDWEFYVKVYADDASCHNYTLAVEVVDAPPQEAACDSSYLPYNW